jgi:hypothetical protein
MNGGLLDWSVISTTHHSCSRKLHRVAGFVNAEPRSVCVLSKYGHSYFKNEPNNVIVHEQGEARSVAQLHCTNTHKTYASVSQSR